MSDENKETSKANLEAWLNTIPLPYTMKRSEMVKEKLFFEPYLKKEEQQNYPVSDEAGLELDDSFLKE